MPITIWEPARYVAGWAMEGYDQVNGNKQPAPYCFDTKIREVTRFTGWTEDFYANTGECEFVINGQYVQPDDVKKGRMIEIDGRHYEIEDFSWEVTENGHECTISGRDLGGKLDKWIDAAHMTVNDPLNGYGNPITIDWAIRPIIDIFFGMYIGNSYNFDNAYAAAYPYKCGWWRDAERLPLYYGEEFEIPGTSDKTFNNMVVENMLSFGSSLRLLCNLFGIGYRFDVVFNEYIKMHYVQFRLYNRANQGVTFLSTGRGIKGYSYSYESRNEVNAIVLTATSRWRNGADVPDTDEPVAISALVKKISGTKNYAEQAEAISMGVEEIGEVPEENDTSYEAARKWLLKQKATSFESANERVTFDYDNSGDYKYGVHFFLGSPVSLYDDFTGINTTQVLTGVKTSYEAGKIKNYSFLFGSQRVTQDKILRKKFASLDNKTFSRRVYS